MLKTCFARKITLTLKRNKFMKNGNEARDLLGNSRQRSRTRPRIAIENPDLTKNQSDSRIRYRAL